MMGKPLGERQWNWKGDAAGADAKRHRAQRLFVLGDCEQCGENAVDRHHIDGDPGNNDRSNVMLLCRRCHMAEDGRLERNLAGGRQPEPPKPCASCERPSKPLRRGLCSRCFERKRRPYCKSGCGRLRASDNGICPRCGDMVE